MGLENILNKVKKTVASVGIATALVAGATANSGCSPLGIPFYNAAEDSSPLSYGEFGLSNGNRYVGEKYGKPPWGGGQYTPYAHGYGTMFDKDGRIVYEGYWNMGNPTGRDPLNRSDRK